MPQCCHQNLSQSIDSLPLRAANCEARWPLPMLVGMSEPICSFGVDVGELMRCHSVLP